MTKNNATKENSNTCLARVYQEAYLRRRLRVGCNCIFRYLQNRWFENVWL